MTRSATRVGTGSPGVNSFAQNSSAGMSSGRAPAGVDEKVLRTTSGSMTTLQLTVPSSASTSPDQWSRAGLTVPFPIWLREKMSDR